MADQPRLSAWDDWETHLHQLQAREKQMAARGYIPSVSSERRGGAAKSDRRVSTATESGRRTSSVQGERRTSSVAKGERRESTTSSERRTLTVPSKSKHRDSASKAERRDSISARYDRRATSLTFKPDGQDEEENSSNQDDIAEAGPETETRAPSPVPSPVPSPRARLQRVVPASDDQELGSLLRENQRLEAELRNAQDAAARDVAALKAQLKKLTVVNAQKDTQLQAAESARAQAEAAAEVYKAEAQRALARLQELEAALRVKADVATPKPVPVAVQAPVVAPAPVKCPVARDFRTPNAHVSLPRPTPLVRAKSSGSFEHSTWYNTTPGRQQAKLELQQRQQQQQQQWLQPPQEKPQQWAPSAIAPSETVTSSKVRPIQPAKPRESDIPECIVTFNTNYPEATFSSSHVAATTPLPQFVQSEQWAEPVSSEKLTATGILTYCSEWIAKSPVVQSLSLASAAPVAMSLSSKVLPTSIFTSTSSWSSNNSERSKVLPIPSKNDHAFSMPLWPPLSPTTSPQSPSTPPKSNKVTPWMYC